MTSAAAQPAHRAARPPSALLAWTELPRALIDLAALPLASPFLLGAARGDGHPVMVLPGFLHGDLSTILLRAYLRRLGYDVHGWGLGRNLGPRTIGAQGELLAARVRDIHARTGRRVSLVGWSLGGVMARLVGSRMPHAVRQIVTFGSPIAGDPRATTLWRLYERLAGHKVDDPATLAQLAEAFACPGVPVTSLYTRRDGIVAWRNCRDIDGSARQSIAVRGSHSGLRNNALVFHVVADRLALPDREWRPFAAGPRTRWAFPAADDPQQPPA